MALEFPSVEIEWGKQTGEAAAKTSTAGEGGTVATAINIESETETEDLNDSKETMILVDSGGYPINLNDDMGVD